MRVRRLMPWAGALVLAAGIVAVIVAFVPSRNPAQPVALKPAPKPASAPKTVPLSKTATSVGRQFLKTAVAREDLAAAWRISGPKLRGDLTYKEWLTGNIPVIPYPLEAIGTARFKIDYSHSDDALIEVALLPKAGSKVKGQIFFLELTRIREPGGKRRWVVNGWVPHSSVLVPQGAN